MHDKLELEAMKHAFTWLLQKHTRGRNHKGKESQRAAISRIELPYHYRNPTDRYDKNESDVVFVYCEIYEGDDAEVLADLFIENMGGLGDLEAEIRQSIAARLEKLSNPPSVGLGTCHGSSRAGSMCISSRRYKSHRLNRGILAGVVGNLKALRPEGIDALRPKRMTKTADIHRMQRRYQQWQNLNRWSGPSFLKLQYADRPHCLACEMQLRRHAPQNHTSIHVGLKRQLFADNHCIESIYGMERVLGTAIKRSQGDLP